MVAASSGYVFHNRLTHSLQVAQVARRLAEKLRLDYPSQFGAAFTIDPDVVEAAAMAHDLGHPPFGHVIEEELDELSKKFGGFEGNAQSFRIICRLAFHSPTSKGLDLTRATLSAVLKYPWLKGENKGKPRKWGAYESESKQFRFARKSLKGFAQTPEAFLMDWADDITYSVHDLEDFYRAGRIPLHLLGGRDDSERQYFFSKMEERQLALGNSAISVEMPALRDIFKDLMFTFPPMQPYRGTERQRTQLRSFTGFLIDRYINSVKLIPNKTAFDVVVAKEFRDEVSLLKELTWSYVIQDPALATQQMGQRNMVCTLYEAYANAALRKSEWRLFPAYYQERLQYADHDSEKLRVCVDLIAGMTEVQVHRVFARITGNASDASLLDPFS